MFLYISTFMYLVTLMVQVRASQIFSQPLLMRQSFSLNRVDKKDYGFTFLKKLLTYLGFPNQALLANCMQFSFDQIENTYFIFIFVVAFFKQRILKESQHNTNTNNNKNQLKLELIFLKRPKDCTNVYLLVKKSKYTISG